MIGEVKSADKSAKKKQYKTWMKSSKSDDVTKEVRVEEIENGFIVSLNEWGNKKGSYFDDSKKYFSKDNPLSDEYISTENGLDGAIDEFIGNM